MNVRELIAKICADYPDLQLAYAKDKLLAALAETEQGQSRTVITFSVLMVAA